jgi:hypothetical protein
VDRPGAVGTRFSVVDSTTDPDRNGTFAEPLPAGSYTSTTGRNPYTADVTQERNGPPVPGFFQLDLRLGYRVHPGSRPLARPLSRTSST